MKRLIAMIAASGLLASLALATAEDKVKVQVGPGGTRVDTPGAKVAAPAPGEGIRNLRAGGRPMRASKTIGMEVKNAKGESLGSINDFVIDEKGVVRYAAVTHGAVLGVGGKLFAVPYSALRVKTAIDNETPYFELNVEKALLDKAPGFASDKWPDFGDERFMKEIDSFYLDAGNTKVKVERP